MFTNLKKINYFRYKMHYLMHCLTNKAFRDYLYIPFGATNPLPANAIEIMKKGCGILSDLGVEYCLADGTLLGVVRDNRLIPHDTDIDISVLHPVDTRRIEKAFLKNGFKIGRKVTASGKVQQCIFYSKEEVLFDIIFYTKIGNNVFAFNEKDFYLKHSAIHYEKFLPYEFADFTFYIPTDTSVWLEHVYGVDWRMPRKSKPKDWREGGNEYLTALPYDGNVEALLQKLHKEESM